MIEHNLSNSSQGCNIVSPSCALAGAALLANFLRDDPAPSGNSSIMTFTVMLTSETINRFYLFESSLFNKSS